MIFPKIHSPVTVISSRKKTRSASSQKMIAPAVIDGNNLYSGYESQSILLGQRGGFHQIFRTVMVGDGK